MLNRLTIALLLSLAVAFPFASPAEAHAIIMKSQPVNGATLAVSGMPINLHFNSRIDHHRSMVTITGPGGVTATLPISPQSPADSILTSVSGLIPGNYVLHWQVLSVDGHLTRGDIPFTTVPVSTP